MDKLTKHTEQLIDILCERRAFERATLKIYDAIIGKLEMSNDIQVHRTLQVMHRHRDEEKEHADWLEGEISELGGDAQGETDLSRLVGIEALGLEAAVMDGDNNPGHLFHALLAAELLDNAGWELLVALAEEAGDKGAKKAFKKRLRQEELHLEFARRAVASFTCANVLGEELEMPASA
jgi:bacterioferritin (cytochrome b1)